jgi:hypothetical protein
MPTLTEPAPVASPPVRRSRRRRRGFLAAAAVGLVALATTLAVSFTADTGTVSVSASGKSASTLVYLSSAALPVDGMTWQSGATTAQKTTLSNLAVGANGYVTRPGDLAMIDTTPSSTNNAANVLVTVYLANAGQYSASTPTFALPVELYCSAATLTTGSTPSFTSWATWSPFPQDTTATFLTNDSPSLSWTVPATVSNQYCEISLGGFTTPTTPLQGGSIYTASVTNGTNSPDFYITATPVGAAS